MNRRLPGSRTVSGGILAVSLVMLLVSGCTSVEKPDYPPEALRDAIRGADAEIPIEEVTALEKREFSPVRTGLAGLGVSAVAVIAVATSVFLGFIAGL